MNLLEPLAGVRAIYGRRAVREYESRQVDRDRIQTLIDAAIQAPSAMNLQPWAFAVVEGVERLREYSERAKAQLLENKPPPEQFAHLLGEGVNIFHDAPVLVVICATDALQQSAEDCCLAAENLMLAAYAGGLGTCPIGFSRAWLEMDDTKRSLGIPEEFVPVFPVVIGYPKAWPPSHGRRAPNILWPAR